MKHLNAADGNHMFRAHSDYDANEELDQQDSKSPNQMTISLQRSENEASKASE